MAVTYHSAKTTRKIRVAPSSTSDAGNIGGQTITQHSAYDAFENLQRGILPSNEELKLWLHSIQASGVLRGAGMSESGQRLFRDIEELLLLAEKAIDQKNKDEIFQRFVYHSRLARRIIADDLTRTGKIEVSRGRNRRIFIGGSKEQRIRQNFKSTRRRAQSNIKSLYSVLQLLVTSTVFREILSDVQMLARHALSKETSSSPSSTIVMPVITESTMNQPQATYRYTEPSSIEELKRRVDRTSAELEQLRTRVGGRDEGIPIPKDLPEIDIATFPSQPSLQPFSSSIPYVEMDKAQRLPIVTPPSFQSAEYRETFRPEIGGKQETEPERVPSPVSITEEQRKPALQKESPKDYIDSLIDDLRRIIVKINGSPEFKLAFSELYKFVYGLQSIPKSMTEPVVPRELRYEANFRQAQRDLLHIMERFSNNASLNPTLHAIESIRREASHDYKLKDFIGDWTSYLTRCIQDQEYIDHPEFRSRGRFLFERTREFHNEKYRPMFDDAFNSVREFTNGWSKDELTMQIGRCIDRIVRQDLMGQPDVSDRSSGFMVLNLLKPDLFNDFRNVMLPNVLRQLHDVPLPRIEALYGGNRLILENLVLPADAFLPMDFVMKAKSKLKLHPKSRIFGQYSSKLEEDKGWTNGLVIHISDIKTSVRDVKFSFEHPNAFPRISDAGLADIHIGGQHGLNMTIQLLSDARDVTLSQEKRPRLYPQYVRVSIDNLRAHFHHSSHDTSYKFLSPVINYSLKKAIEGAICERIVNSVEFIDNVLSRIAKRM